MGTLEEWFNTLEFKTTKEMKVPEKLVDQVIGQEEAVEVIKKAAEQKRHVMLVGEPGTGKSMLARAMSELLPKEELQDILAYPNTEDPHEPKIKVLPCGKGKSIVAAERVEALRRKAQKDSMLLSIGFFVILLAVLWAFYTKDYMIVIVSIVAVLFLILVMRLPSRRASRELIPKILVSHTEKDNPPFIDSTGAHAGALLGDVRHDPYQSGGLETPPHERVEVGAIHKANKGVLFIDEINTIRQEDQQNLLTALQEKQFPISGQSERSAGALVKTQPVPCDFVLVIAGNLDAVQSIHPALRSRIRGYGYEIYMKSLMEDNDDNRKKLIRFIAQEVVKDGKIPHFDKSAALEIVREAQRRAGCKGKLSLRLRELGGLIRAAGDIAVERFIKALPEDARTGAIKRAKEEILVTAEDVLDAKKLARSLEQQVADRLIDKRKEYRSFRTEGTEIGAVNGLAVIGADTGISEYSGIVLPIVAEVAPAHSRAEGKIIATGKLGEIAKEAVQNVSAIIKKYTGKDISHYDIHIQFIGTYEGVEGDSASISVATAVISALENVEVDQTVGMTGSLSLRGEVLPVGGITAKIEAAAENGLKKIIIPKANLRDVLIEERYKNKIEVIGVETIKEVLDCALIGVKKSSLLEKLSLIVPRRFGATVPAP
ncbi:MAG: ATP-dependent protease LonB [Candidatus Thermoplasmatota archaeon]|nr:ATP-dependent protease LonB [Candidatus Thermoplasmatota archaeon]